MFGSHLSIANGMHNALLSAEKYEMDTVQVFTNIWELVRPTFPTMTTVMPRGN